MLLQMIKLFSHHLRLTVRMALIQTLFLVLAKQFIMVQILMRMSCPKSSSGNLSVLNLCGVHMCASPLVEHAGLFAEKARAKAKAVCHPERAKVVVLFISLF